MIEIAGINKSIRPHDLRHTFAVSLRRQGIGIETIKELMRHANIEETLIYAKYDLEEGRKAMAKLPDFFS